MKTESKASEGARQRSWHRLHGCFHPLRFGFRFHVSLVFLLEEVLALKKFMFLPSCGGFPWPGRFARRE